MKRLLSLLFGLLVLAAITPASRAEEAAAKMATPAFWTVEGAKGKMYLFGSVHMLSANSPWLTPAIEAAYTASDALILEADIAHIDQAAVAQKTIELGRYAAGEAGLQSRVTPETYAGLVALAAPFGLTGEVLNPLRPWLVGILLPQLTLVRAGISPDLGVDRAFATRAASTGKPIIGLEGIIEQLEMIAKADTRPEQEQIAELVEKFPKSLDVVRAMFATWSKGDTEALWRLLNEQLGSSRGVYDTLIVARNKAWTEKIAGHLGDGKTYFLVVGAGHFAGPDSVVEMLKAKGYKVVRQ